MSQRISLSDNRILHFGYCFALCLWVLPSGSVLSVPVKPIIYLVFLAVLLVSLVLRNSFRYSKGFIILLVSLIPLSIWAVYGIMNGFAQSTAKILVSFVSLLLIVFISLIYLNNYSNEQSLRLIIKCLYISTFVFILFKIILETLFFFGVLSGYQCKDLFRRVLNSSVMTYTMKIGRGTFCRFSTPNDTIPLLILSYDLAVRNRKLSYRIAQFLLFGLYVLIVFSRLYILQFVLVYLFCGFFLAYSSRRKMSRWIVIAAAAFVVLVAVMIFQPQWFDHYIKTIIASRFSGTDVEQSDSIRTTQIVYLLDAIKSRPLFGYGLGAYLKDYIRSSASPASYEAEYLSFLLQFGIIGFCLIILPIISVFYLESVRKTTVPKIRLVILFNFVIWSVKPFFNPHFLSSCSGTLVSALFILAVYSMYSKGLAAIIDQ